MTPAERDLEEARADLLRIGGRFVANAAALLGNDLETRHDRAIAQGDGAALERSLAALVATVAATGGTPEAQAGVLRAALEALNHRFIAGRVIEAKAAILKTEKDRAGADKATAGKVDSATLARGRIEEALRQYLAAHPADTKLSHRAMAETLVSGGATAAPHRAAAYVGAMKVDTVRKTLAKIRA